VIGNNTFALAYNFGSSPGHASNWLVFDKLIAMNRGAAFMLRGCAACPRRQVAPLTQWSEAGRSPSRMGNPC
jgi:hypothetical protein